MQQRLATVVNKSIGQEINQSIKQANNQSVFYQNQGTLPVQLIQTYLVVRLTVKSQSVPCDDHVCDDDNLNLISYLRLRSRRC